MIDQNQVDAWLSEFVTKLKNNYGSRLRWVGHHGSWGRGEPGPESDIDFLVLIDTIDKDDLFLFRDTVSSMSDAQPLGSGLLMSVEELQQTRRVYIMQFFYGRKELYGSVEGIVSPPCAEDFINDIRLKASDNLLAARHYLLFPHNLTKVAPKLKYPFKNCFYALQSRLLLTQGKFIATKNEILKRLDDPDDKEVVIVARDWHKLTDDLTARPAYYIELLERWARGMISKLQSFLDSHEA